MPVPKLKTPNPVAIYDYVLRKNPWTLVPSRVWAARPPQPHLVDGLIPNGSLGMLFGAPMSGKSFLALDLALSIANGYDWAGRSVSEGPVVYVLAEGGLEFGKRVRAWFNLYPDAQEDISLLLRPVSLFAPGPRGAEPRYSPDVGRLIDLVGEELSRRTFTGWDDDQDDDQDADVEAVNPRLIILDTFSQCCPGANENAAEDMSLVLQEMDRLRKRFECTVLAVHHTRKSDARTMRGSSALLGGIEFAMNVRRRGDDVTVECVKAKDLAEFGKLHFDLVASGDQRHGSMIVQHKGDTSPASAVSTTVGDDEDASAAHVGKQLEAVYTALLIEPRRQAELSSVTGIPLRTLQRRVVRLRKLGVIERIPDGPYQRVKEVLECGTLQEALDVVMQRVSASEAE